MTPKQILILRKKICHQYDRHFGAYLTPAEIVHVVEKMEGVVVSGEWKLHYNRAKEQVKSGKGSASWFYFDVKHVGRFLGLTP